jgi:hypothetical protein
MAYIGREPVIGNFVKLDAISVVNGQAAYTMNNGGSAFTNYDNVNQFLVSLNGILQAPTDSFTVSGSTLTFASNLATGDVIDFVIVLGNTLDIGTPSDSTVSLAKLTATGTKDATTFLRGDNTFAVAGGSNTPAFSAYLSSDQTGLSANTDHKITINAEDFDTDGAFDHSSNYRFTPQTAGKYFFHGQIKCSLSTANDFVAKIKKNGSDTKNRRMENVDQDAVDVSCVLDMNGSSDYVELFGRFTNTTFNAVAESGVTTFFLGYRLIT